MFFIIYVPLSPLNKKIHKSKIFLFTNFILYRNSEWMTINFAIKIYFCGCEEYAKESYQFKLSDFSNCPSPFLFSTLSNSSDERVFSSVSNCSCWCIEYLSFVFVGDLKVYVPSPPFSITTTRGDQPESNQILVS